MIGRSLLIRMEHAGRGRAESAGLSIVSSSGSPMVGSPHSFRRFFASIFIDDADHERKGMIV